MADKAWKQHERDIALWFGGRRRGPLTGRGRLTSGHTDVEHDVLALEGKLLSRPGFADCLKAVEQAEAAREPHHELAVAVVRRKGDRKTEALAIVRAQEFAAWLRGRGALKPAEPAKETGR